MPTRGVGPVGSAARAWGALSLVLMAALLASLLWPAPPLLLWNASGSSPVGLYSVTAATPRVGEMAVAWAPPAARQIAAARSYLPLRVPLVKRVAAVRGDRVCARGNRLFVNGRFAAVRRSSDPSGRAMPWWSGCVRLGRGDLLLLSADRALAFDGRYFGVTRASDVIGKAELLWAR